MLNVAVLQGRLVADPELRYTPNNIPVVRFRIAVDRNYTPQGQERKADFIDIVAWRQQAEFVCKYFRKGQMVVVQGEIQTDSYTDKDGNKRNRFEISADRVHFGESKNSFESRQGGSMRQDYGRSDFAAPSMPAVQQPATSFAVGEPDDFQEVADDSDLPF